MRATIGELIDQGIIVAHKDGNYGSLYPRTGDFGETGTIFLTAKNVGDDGRIDFRSAQRLNDNKASAFKFGWIKNNDVLLSHNATVGRVAVVGSLNERALVGTSLTYFTLDTSRLLPGYFASFLRGRNFQSQLEAVMSYSTRNQVPITIQKQLSVDVPPFERQKVIAHILGTLDDKIELNRKTNETLEVMAKVLFKSWFVDFDPVRAKAEGRPTGLPAEISDLFPDSFEDSELGETPRGWEPRAIREWGRTECGKTPSTHNQEFYGSDYMFVTIPDLHNGFQIVTSGKQLSELGADSQRKKLLPPGSVMVSCIATPGLVGVAKEACFTNQQINSIIPSSKEASWFLALAMIENRDLLLSLGGSGSVFFNLSKGRFDEIEILAPSEDLISAFSGVVSALMDRCFATKQEIIALTDVRDALLPKLISGEIRIPDAEKLLEEAGI
jgi:type I restriction enzyme S subunit